MTITPAQAGFIKGLGLALLAAATAYLSNPENLTFLSGGIALIVSALASSLESHIKANSGNALFGAVSVR